MKLIQTCFASAYLASETRNRVRPASHALTPFTFPRPGEVRTAPEQVQLLAREAGGLASKMKALLAKRIVEEQTAGGGVDDGSQGSGGAAHSTRGKRSSAESFQSASGGCASGGGASKRGKRGGGK